jgi:hypothetical protein
MPTAEITISTLGDLIDRLTPSAPDPATGHLRNTGVYRGTADPQSAMLTSLDQLGGTEPPHTKIDLEGHILRNYIRYARPYLTSAPVNDWELLIAAQHHGVPTRLLDWTSSPLIAAFFATRPVQKEGAQGVLGADRARVIWRLDWHAVHQRFGLPTLTLRIEELAPFLGVDDTFTPWQLFDGRVQNRPFACLIEPPSLDARIVSQAALFTLTSTTTASFDQFLARHGLGSALTKFVIPADSVAKIRDQLDLTGIDERHVFPDLDGVAGALRRYYA